MATYGAAGQNTYSIPNVVGFFSNEVNATTGVTQIYKQGPFLTQESVGTYNPKTKKFTPDPTSSITQSDITKISSPDGLKAIKNASIQTTKKGIIAAGGDPQSAQTQAEKINDTNTTASPPSPDEFKLEDATKGTEALNELNIQSAKFRENYGDWVYPLKFPENQDRIKFTMVRYNPRSFGVNENLGSFSRERVTNPNQKQTFGTVTLPITPSITDTNTVSWGSADINAFQALAAAASYAGITKGAGGIEQSATTIMNALKNNDSIPADLKMAAATYFAGQAADVNQGLLSRVQGAVLNPNTELLFNGPQLRTHSFSFTLSARDPKESEQIRNIIRFFKQGMAVHRASSQLFLKAPNIFDIKYYLKGSADEHPWMNKIKTCALASCTVNYTPAGNYATYYDGAMTSYEITLGFNELDPIYEDDYDNPNGFNKPDTTIGY